MTYDQFADGLIQLAENHGRTLTPGQIQAYFKLLGYHDVRDWEWTVIRLTAADRFPRDHKDMLIELDRARTDRKRVEADKERQQAERLFNPSSALSDSWQEDLFVRCCVNLRRLSQTSTRAAAITAIKAILENYEWECWAKQQHSDRLPEGSQNFWEWINQHFQDGMANEAERSLVHVMPNE
ncbi:MAG: hypothetical protein KC643_33505 [Nitrospira sp.]|nr:hypothetical protein [Nitrospira sp.]